MFFFWQASVSRKIYYRISFVCSIVNKYTWHGNMCVDKLFSAQFVCLLCLIVAPFVPPYFWPDPERTCLLHQSWYHDSFLVPSTRYNIFSSTSWYLEVIECKRRRLNERTVFPCDEWNKKNSLVTVRVSRIKWDRVLLLRELSVLPLNPPPAPWDGHSARDRQNLREEAPSVTRESRK